MVHKISLGVLAVLFLFFCFIAFNSLGVAPLENWDEAWYGENIKQMVRTGEVFVLQFNKDVFWEKPPLYMWLSAPFVLMIGLSEFSVRLVAALCGIATLGLVLWISYKKFGLVPALFAFIVLGLNNIFIWRTRTGNLDTLPTLLILFVFLAMVSKWKYRYVALGVLFALLYLAKLSIVVFPGLVFVLHELVFMRSEWKKNLKQYGLMVLITVGIITVWLIPGFLKIGPSFLISTILQSDKGAASTALSNFKTDYVMYAYYSLQRRFFWVVLGGIILLIPQILKNRWHFGVFLFSTLLIVQLTFNERSNNWYLVPSMPFWAFASAYGIHWIIEFARKRKIPFYPVGVGGMVFVAVFLSYRFYTTNIIPMYSTFSSTREATTARFVKENSGEKDVMARLDHLYPTTVYYSERKVYSVPENYTGNTGSLFMSRDSLARELKAKKVRFVVGTKGDMEAFLKKYSLQGYKSSSPIDGELVADFK